MTDLSLVSGKKAEVSHKSPAWLLVQRWRETPQDQLSYLLQHAAFPTVDIFKRWGKRLEGRTCEILETQVVGESFDEVVDTIMEGERVELFTVAHVDLKGTMGKREKKGTYVETEHYW